MATNFLSLSRDAFDASTTWIDANARSDWDYSLKAFRNEHAPGSKFTSSDYQSRSKVFFPKTRSVIRKNEAAAAMSLFSNTEIVQVAPGNPSNPLNVASAQCLKYLIEYRMKHTLRAFPLVMGAFQDAQATGAVCSYNYWEYQRKGEKIVKDQPCIKLRPVENLRFDPGADWLDPVNSSPYWCDIVPMYVCDVKAMMRSRDDKTGAKPWKKLADSVILKATPDVMDSTRKARQGEYQDPQTDKREIKDFDLVWVMRWCMRDGIGDDYCYYTLGTEDLLSDPAPIEEVYFHGKRPYTMGYAVLETHKALKSSVPVLVRPIQQAINTLGNQRFDNVQFVLNKRRYVRRGAQVDVQSLVRNVPGGVTMTNDPQTDVRDENWADVTSSSYVEHDRFNSALDDLVGNFSPSTRVANNAANDTLGGSRMAAQGAGVMTDYLIMTVIESWYEPTLQQLALLEQYYETDPVVLGVCEQKAKLFQRFGLNRLTDEMLMLGVNVNVDVGMGASDPSARFQKFMIATKAAIDLVNTAPPAYNVQEGVNEIYANAGYRDASRFWHENGGDPRLLKAMQMVQQLGQALKSKGMEIQAQGQLKQLEIASSDRQKAAQLEVDRGRISGDLAIRQAELALEEKKVELETLKYMVELNGANLQQRAELEKINAQVAQSQLELQTAREQADADKAKAAADVAASVLNLETAQREAQNQQEVMKVAGNVQKTMGDVAAQIAALKASLSASDARAAALESGLSTVGSVVSGIASRPQRKPVKVSGGKKAGKVVVSYDDDSVEEIAVSGG